MLTHQFTPFPTQSGRKQHLPSQGASKNCESTPSRAWKNVFGIFLLPCQVCKNKCKSYAHTLPTMALRAHEPLVTVPSPGGSCGRSDWLAWWSSQQESAILLRVRSKPCNSAGKTKAAKDSDTHFPLNLSTLEPPLKPWSLLEVFDHPEPGGRDQINPNNAD